jgi:hypothetical protein
MLSTHVWLQSLLNKVDPLIGSSCNFNFTAYKNALLEAKILVGLNDTQYPICNQKVVTTMHDLKLSRYHTNTKRLLSQTGIQQAFSSKPPLCFGFEIALTLPASGFLANTRIGLFR